MVLIGGFFPVAISFQVIFKRKEILPEGGQQLDNPSQEVFMCGEIFFMVPSPSLKAHLNNYHTYGPQLVPSF